MTFWIGMAAGTITSLGFLPQIIKVIKTGRSEDISILQPIVLSIGIALWLVYGIILAELPMILANTFGLICNLILLVFKLREN